MDERVLILLRGRLGVGGNLLHGLSLVPRKRCPLADPAPFGGGPGSDGGDAEAVPAMRAGEALAGALDTGNAKSPSETPHFRPLKEPDRGETRARY